MIDLRTLAAQAGAPKQRLAELCGVSLATLERYLREGRCPPAVAELLKIYAGRMPWPGFEQMQVIRGVIYYRDNPDGVPADEIPPYPYRLRELRALRDEVTRYRRAPAQYLFDLEVSA